MIPSRWTDGHPGPGAGPRRTDPGRAVRALRPGCAALDGRLLLSTVAAAPAVLPTPSAAAVANAAAELNALNPSGFARLQNELAQAEGHSRVTPALASTLAQDEVTLDRAIETLGQGRSTPSDLLTNVNNLNDKIDNAFFGDMIEASPEFIDSLRWAVEKPESWGQLKGDLSSLSISPSVIHQTAHQMEVVARAVHLTPQLKRAFWNNPLIASLGSNPDTNLGPGAAGLDAVQVYLDAQVNNFIEG